MEMTNSSAEMFLKYSTGVTRLKNQEYSTPTITSTNNLHSLSKDTLDNIHTKPNIKLINTGKKI